MEVVKAPPTPFPKFRLEFSMAGGKQHSLLYKDERLGVQAECHTPVLNPGADWPEFGEEKWYFSIAGDKRVFRSIETLMRAWARKRKRPRFEPMTACHARRVLRESEMEALGWEEAR